MITDNQVALYWGQKFRPDLRKKADEIAAQVQIHSRKLTPTAILDAFRPNETEAHKKYRKAVWKPITFGWFNKVLQQFAKIRRAEDWRIEWPANVPNNPVQDYTARNFAEYDSVENWFFNYHLRNVVDDPNGVVIVLPRNIEEILLGEPLNPSEPFRPTPFYFPSSAVVDYTETLLVVNAQEAAVDDFGRKLANATRPVMYFFDQDEVVKVVETSTGDRPTYSRFAYTHRLGFTAFLNGGLMAEDQQKERRKLYDSFIAPAIPFWEAAISGESDHQVNMALHLHPDRWELVQAVCQHKVHGRQCNGGFIDTRVGSTVVPMPCPACQGLGKIAPKSPFGVTKVQREAVGLGKGEYGPIPPGGYFERPTETIKITKELADAKLYDGLDALGLGMLGVVPLNQSGKAKEVDYQEVDTYIAQFGAHAVDNILVNVFFFSAAWLLPYASPDQRAALLPSINKPRKFDLVTTDVWQARVAAYSEKGFAPSAKAEAEIKLAERQHGPDSTAFFRIRDTIILDPLYGLTAPEKTETALGGGCSREDYIISTKIGYFVTRAVVETSGAFHQAPFDVRAALMLKYAQETLTPAGLLAGALGGNPDAAAAPATGGDDPTAALRGSVGGSAIIRQLRTDVIKGLSSREAAINQIVIQLGYSRDEAEKMLGETVLNLKDQVKSGEVAATAV